MKTNKEIPSNSCMKCNCDNEPSHTPTPLSIDGIRNVAFREVCTLSQGERTIVSEISVKDAAYIVRAVNSYEKDQKTIAELLDLIKEMRPKIQSYRVTSESSYDLLVRIDKAIAKAEGK